MELKEKFEKILGENERVIKIYRPKRLKFFLGRVFGSLFSCLFLIIFIVIVALLASSDLEFFDESGNPAEIPFTIITIILVCILAFIILISVIIPLIEYKNIYYALTNKRVIIRRGIIGVDFRSLDLENIGAINVDVTFVDKLLHQNTGTLSFGSNSMPMIQMSNGTSQMYGYSFRDIEDPYRVYKEIKAYIDSIKGAK